MIRISEFAGLFAGLALFLGTLIAAQAYVAHDAPDLRAALIETLD